ncbi:MAG: MopE-related protein [Chitinophagales bacterium]
MQTTSIQLQRTARRILPALFFLSFLILFGADLKAEANYVYHEQTTANPGCGAANYMSSTSPNNTAAVTLAWKIEYQFYTTNTVIYYTTDGSTPSGAFGVGSGTTQVIAGVYSCSFGGPAVDVATATIPVQPAGTIVKYKIGTWHSGGGNEIFANGPGAPCGCGTPTNNASLATLFSYTVTASNNVEVTASAGTALASYATVKAAFDAINAGTHTGTVNVRIWSNTTEVSTAVLNSSGAGAASYSSVTIRPYADAITVSGALATGRGVIELKGADNITIDGDNPNTSGTNRNLTITNTASNTTTYTSVIRIANATTVVASSDNITIKNCNLNGSATSRNASANTSTTGSENTTFGIYVGGNGGSTATDAPTAISSVTSNTAPSGTTVNNLLINNNAINACARGIVFNGAASTVSSGVTITNNVLGDQSTLVGIAPYTTPANTVYAKGIFIAGTNAIAINNNTLKNIMSYVGTTIVAIELNGSIGTGTITINDNTITGVVNNGTVSACNAILVSSAGTAYTIRGNVVSNVQAVAGISLAGAISVGIGSATIEKNKLSNIWQRSTSTFGVYGINVTGGSNDIIQNNFIWDVNHDMSGGAAFSTTFGVFGIRIASGTGHLIYHNSVNLYGAMTGTSTSSLLSAPLCIVSTSSTGMNIRNNIFSNNITGGTTSIAHVCIYLPSGATSSLNLTLNNNAYYSGTDNARQGIAQAGTTAGTGFYLASNFNAGAILPSGNLRAYTSTLSAAGTNDNASYASTSTSPYTSDTDLHLNVLSAEINSVEQKAATGTGVTVDIDGDVRPNTGTTIPDIGGDEAAQAACAGTPAGGSISPATATVCSGLTYNMSATGASVGTGISYQWQVSTTGGGVGFTSGWRIRRNYYCIYYCYTFCSAKYYRLKVICTTGPDSSFSNELTLNVTQTPSALAGSNSPVCQGTSINLSGGTDVGTAYSWTGPGGFSSLLQNPVIASATVSNAGTYTFIASNGTCNSAPSNTVVVVNANPSGITANATPTTLCAGGTINLTSGYDPNFGYSMNTSGTESFVDISGTGTAVSGTVTDDSEHDVALPFAFTFNGVSYTNMRVGNNGAVLFGSPGGDINYTNRALPAPIGANNTDGLTGGLGTLGNIGICPWWDDLTPSTGIPAGSIKTQTIGSKFIIQWTNEDHFDAAGTGTVTFQVQLEQTTNKIHFVYSDVNFSGTAAEDQGGSATIGLNFGTSSALQYTHNTKSLTDGKCITFTPIQPVISWTGPGGFTSAVQNPTILSATPAASGIYTVTYSNPVTGCSTSASTTSVTVNANVTYYADLDVDGYGDPSNATVSCVGAPLGYITDNTDCNDSNGSVHPGATEICNGLDDNCNGLTDDGLTYTTYYADTEGDGFGDAGSSISSCLASPPAGYVDNSLDCQPLYITYTDADGDGFGFGVPVPCGPVINHVDCDDTQWLYQDSDGDGYGAGAAVECGVPTNTDCAPFNAAINPGTTEVCNGVDDDCSGVADDGLTFATWYPDADADGYGDAYTGISTCDGAPLGYIADNTDCDDTQNTVYPGAPEICDGYDNDCNGLVDEGTVAATITPAGTAVTCKGVLFTFYANTGVGYTYQWFKNGNQIFGATASSYATNKPAYYQVQVNTPEGCFALSDPTFLQVNPNVNANATAPLGTSLCSTVKLKVNFDASYTWQWYRDAVLIPGATNYLYNATIPGDYTCAVMNAYGCSKISNTITVTACKEGEIYGATEVNVYPNPNDGSFQLDVSAAVADDIAYIEIFNAVGASILHAETAVHNGLLHVSLDMGDQIPSGMYMVKVTTGGQSISKQIAVQR